MTTNVQLIMAKPGPILGALMGDTIPLKTGLIKITNSFIIRKNRTPKTAPTVVPIPPTMRHPKYQIDASIGNWGGLTIR